LANLFGVMTIPILLVIIHGAVAVNIESVYSAPLCMLAGGIKLKRWVGSIISGVIASGVLVAFIASSSFATSFTNYMNSFVIWTAAWGAIIVVDYYVINRGRTDVPALYDAPEKSRYGDVRWSTLLALLIGLAAGWAFEYGSVKLFQGPLSRATNGVDFSWLASILFAAVTYYVAARIEGRGVVAPAAPAPAHSTAEAADIVRT
jgi:nucleobase:cation symporter-1, NCS1 family